LNKISKQLHFEKEQNRFHDLMCERVSGRKQNSLEFNECEIEQDKE